MANNADRIVDPRFDLPTLIDGYKHGVADGISVSGAGGDDTGVVDDPTVIVIPQPDVLPPPSNISIVEFITRTGADGKTVVDAIIDVEDVVGATEYEVRVST